jgi:hypothetical protein
MTLLFTDLYIIYTDICNSTYDTNLKEWCYGIKEKYGWCFYVLTLTFRSSWKYNIQEVLVRTNSPTFPTQVLLFEIPEPNLM